MSKRSFTIQAEGFPNIQGMMLATILALKALGGSAKIQELDEKVAELEGVTEQEQAFEMTGSNSGQPRLNYYLAWARTYLKRGGAVANSSRAVWSLTEFGKGLGSIEDTQEIYSLVASQERERARAKRIKDRNSDLVAEQDSKEADLSFPAELASGGHHGAWDQELISVLKKMDPSAFERLAQRLLRESGFSKVEVRGKTGDGGIDGVGVLSVNLVSFQVFFQCKRYKGSVGSAEIRDFRGAMMGRADKGLFITTGTYTAHARDEATRDGATAIDLIDGERLCLLLKENELGVKTKMVEEISVEQEFFAGI